MESPNASDNAQAAAPHAPSPAHILAGLCLMFSGWFLPNLSKAVPASSKLLALGLPVQDGWVLITVTDFGMVVTMTFLGVIYLWTFVDTVWPGLLGLCAIICSGVLPPPKIMSMFLGSPVVVTVFFLYLFASAIVASGLARWMAQFAMSRDFLSGRPWLFTAVLLFATYFVAFLDQTTTCFLMWPVLFSVFEQVGYRKGDQYVSLMTVYVCIAILLSSASDPFKGGAFYLLANLQGLAGDEASALNAPTLSLLGYLGFAVILSLAVLGLLLLLMRFVFKADVSRLKNLNVELMKKEPLPPLNSMQKIVLGTFIGYAVWLSLPSIIGTDNAVGLFCSKNQMSATIFAVLALAMIPVKGRPAVDITKTAAYFPWRVFLVVAVAMLLGSLMTSRETNVALYLEYVLRDLLQGMDAVSLTMVLITLGLVLTNFCNSVVLGIMVTPVVLAVASAFSFSPAPMMACFMFAVLIGACTPAASPFAAFLFANTKWVSPGQMAKHAVLASLVVLLVDIFLGIPLAKLFF